MACPPPFIADTNLGVSPSAVYTRTVICTRLDRKCIALRCRESLGSFDDLYQHILASLVPSPHPVWSGNETRPIFGGKLPAL